MTLEQYISKIKSQLHSLDIPEHYELARADHTEQLVDIIKVFHKYCRNMKIVRPIDKPIYTDMDKDSNIVNYRSSGVYYDILYDKYPTIRDSILYDLGFGLQLKKTTLEHPKANSGVYLRLLDKESVPPGTLLGFVPGYFDKLPITREINLKSQQMYRFNQSLFKINEKLPYPHQIYSGEELINMIKIKE